MITVYCIWRINCTMASFMKRKLKIKREIAAIYNSLSEKPNNVAKEHSALYHRACKIFGSWREALKESGINYEKARNNKKWSREKIAKEINRLHHEGKSLRPSQLRNNGGVKLLSAAEYHFGSWRRAVEVSGFNYLNGRNSNPNDKFHKNV
jgi:hypothetical protein